MTTAFLETYRRMVSGADLASGTRVRVRDFSECPFRRQEIWHQVAFSHTWCHQDKLIGREGIIVNCKWPGPAGHRFLVRILPRQAGGTGGGWGHYMAYELEAIDAQAG